jgi:DNA adenine methylase
MKIWDYKKSSTPVPYKVATRGMKAPFKWAGAKNRMFEKYMAKGFFPSGDPKVFVDMFAGTAIVGQWVAANYPNTTIVINETCGELVSMYRQMQRKNFPLFEAEYKRHVAMYSKLSIDDRKKHYYDVRNRYALAYDTMTPVEEAAALFYMLQTGFNGIWQTSDNFNNRFASPAGLMTWKPNGSLFSLDRIKKYAAYLDRCVLLNDDFEKTLCFMGSDTWFYADPPYRASKAKYASAGAFTNYDHVRLCNFLKTASDAGDKCVLSNREDIQFSGSAIRNATMNSTVSLGWFADKFNDDWNVSYFDVKYTAGRHNKGKPGCEVLIKNY